MSEDTKKRVISLKEFKEEVSKIYEVMDILVYTKNIDQETYGDEMLKIVGRLLEPGGVQVVLVAILGQFLGLKRQLLEGHSCKNCNPEDRMIN